MELACDVIKHRRVGTRSPPVLCRMRQVGEHVLNKRQRVGEKEALKRCMRPSAHALAKPCGPHDGMVKRLLVKRSLFSLPRKTDACQCRGPNRSTLFCGRIDDENRSVMALAKRLNEGQHCVDDMAAFINGDACESRFELFALGRLPTVV